MQAWPQLASASPAACCTPSHAAAPPAAQAGCRTTRMRSTRRESRMLLQPLPPLRASNQQGGAPPPPTSREALLAKALAYKQGKPLADAKQPPQPQPTPQQQQPDYSKMVAALGGAVEEGGGEATPVAEQPATPEQQQAEEERRKRFEGANETGNREALPPDQDVGSLYAGARQATQGSAYEAAAALQGVMGKGSQLLVGVDTSGMRMEEITALVEERRRAAGADIFVADASSRPLTKSSRGRIGEAQRSQEADGEEASTSGEGDIYAPKVSTWGVFPRPSNISAAYGGGRTIKPGEQIEDPQQSAARAAEYAASLARYKKKMGLEVDEGLEAEADGIVKQGMELFNEGELQSAYAKFDAASKLVKVRTRVGGQATLQKALVLDSLGRGDEAQKLYKQVSGHPVSELSKKARGMLFGFSAASYLKADQFNYGVRKGDYDPIFRRIIDKNRIYIPSEEEIEADKKAERAAAVTALLVILFPLGLAASLAKGSGAL